MIMPNDQQPPRQDPLHKQLEWTRFERALEIVDGMATRRVLLTTTELARLNNILTGKNEDPWRVEAATLTLPSGQKVTFELIANPVLGIREKLHRATESAEAGAPIDAAIEIYIGLVMSHYFKDANRRSAAIAAHFFLNRYGVPLSGNALHELGLGDLRQPGQIDTFRETVSQMAKFATGRKK